MVEEITNGDKVFLATLRLRIDEINRGDNYESKDADIFSLQIQILSYERLITVDNRVKRHTAYPSLLFLLMNRPLSFLPFSAAVGIAASSLFIDEARLQVSAALGLPADLFSNFGRYSAGAILMLVVTGLIARSKYNVKV